MTSPFAKQKPGIWPAPQPELGRPNGKYYMTRSLCCFIQAAAGTLVGQTRDFIFFCRDPAHFTDVCLAIGDVLVSEGVLARDEFAFRIAAHDPSGSLTGELVPILPFGKYNQAELQERVNRAYGYASGKSLYNYNSLQTLVPAA